MSNHKQHAIGLINQFHPHCGGMEPMQTENAKKCALIHINGLMDAYKPYIFLESIAAEWDVLYDTRIEIENYEV